MSAPVRSSPFGGLFFRAGRLYYCTGNRQGLRRRIGAFRELRVERLRRGFFPSPDGSELCFCPTTFGLSDKNARSARPGPLPSRDPFLSYIMDTNRKQTDQTDQTDKTDKTDKKPRTSSYKYSFRLNEEQNIRFNELLCKAGSEHNRSRFIVKRIFCEEFVVIKRDPSKTQFVARLNDFYFQFQKLANNYNQIVKAVNSHFSNIAIPHQIAMLEQRTRELKALSIEILHLAKQAKEWLRI